MSRLLSPGRCLLRRIESPAIDLQETFGGERLHSNSTGGAGARASRLQQERVRQLRRQARLGPTAAVQDVVGVLVVSAIPFAALQALAESDLGSRLQVLPCRPLPRRKHAQSMQSAACIADGFGEAIAIRATQAERLESHPGGDAMCISEHYSSRPVSRLSLETAGICNSRPA